MTPGLLASSPNVHRLMTIMLNRRCEDLERE